MLASLTSCTCNCYPPEQPEAPGGYADGGVAPPGVAQESYARMDSAAQACVVLKWLNCPEAAPQGMDCADTLRRLLNLGVFPKKDVLCIRTSRTVEKVRRCNVDCRK